mgnify:CR=1 FL=1
MTTPATTTSRAETPIGLGDRVRIKPGIVGAGYEFTVSELYDNTAATVDPCVQVYGTNGYGPARLHELEKIGPSALLARIEGWD